ncbi:MAG: hypothetical protein AB8C95_12645 [Phycisphaeraceae bacterium]
MSPVLKKILILLSCAFAIGLVVVAIKFVVAFNAYGEKMEEIYAAMNVGSLIVNHIDATGEWPSGWEDLFETTPDDSSIDAETIAMFQERIGVQWNEVTLRAIYHADSIEADPFPLVWCYSGAPAGPTDDNDANAMIYRFVQDSYFELLEKRAKRVYEEKMRGEE